MQELLGAQFCVYLLCIVHRIPFIMKHLSIIGLVPGILIGLAMGYVLRGTYDSKRSNQTQYDATSKTELSQISALHNNDQLTVVSQQLNQAVAQLGIAKSRIEQLVPQAVRYEKTRELWKKYGFGSTPLIFKHEGLIPSDTLIEFFDWDDETVSSVNRIGENTEMKILDWESKNAICIENNAERCVFEIPAAPSSIRDDYKVSLESLIGKQDADVLILEVDRKLSKYLTRKKVTFYPFVEDYTTGLSSASSTGLFRFEVKGYNDSPDNNSFIDGEAGVGFIESGTLMYAPDTSFYARWNHLLGQYPY